MAEVLAGGRWTESDVIEAIMEVFPSRRDLVTLGIGDDCAVLARGERLVTTDASVEGVHFDVAWMTLADAAYRCLTSNLSDVAAMGGEPGCFTLALGLRPDLGFDEIRGAIGAMRQCVEEHGLSRCALVGGDVVRSGDVFGDDAWRGSRMAGGDARGGARGGCDRGVGGSGICGGRA